MSVILRFDVYGIMIVINKLESLNHLVCLIPNSIYVLEIFPKFNCCVVEKILPILKIKEGCHAFIWNCQSSQDNWPVRGMPWTACDGSSVNICWSHSKDIINLFNLFILILRRISLNMLFILVLIVIYHFHPTREK